MDMLKISSTFLKGILNKVLAKVIKKQLGYDVNILINDLNIEVNEGKVHLHLNVDGEMDKEEFSKLMKTII